MKPHLVEVDAHPTEESVLGERRVEREVDLADVLDQRGGHEIHGLALVVRRVGHRHGHGYVGIDLIVVIDRLGMPDHGRDVFGRKQDDAALVGRAFELIEDLVLQDDADGIGRMEYGKLVELTVQDGFQHANLVAHEEIFEHAGDVGDRRATVEEACLVVVVAQTAIEAGEHHSDLGLLEHFFVQHREGSVVDGEHQLWLVAANVLLDLLDGLEHLLLRADSSVEEIAFRRQVSEAGLFQCVHRRLVLRLPAGILLVIARDQEDIRRRGRRCERQRREHGGEGGDAGPDLTTEGSEKACARSICRWNCSHGEGLSDVRANSGPQRGEHAIRLILRRAG